MEILEYVQGRRQLSDIDGIDYKVNSKYTHNRERALIPDINILPIPAVDLVPLEKYHTSPDLKLGKKVAMLSTSRGCPSKCTFCAIKSNFNRTYRDGNIEKIFQEIDYYIDRLNIDSLFIVDDTFTLRKDRVIAFCEKMIEKKYNEKIKWWAQTRADRVSLDLLMKMKIGLHETKDSEEGF